jgi:hypothetical protein
MAAGLYAGRAVAYSGHMAAGLSAVARFGSPSSEPALASAIVGSASPEPPLPSLLLEPLSLPHYY